MFIREAVVSILAGTGPATFALSVGTADSFHLPRGVALDSSGIIYATKS